MLFVLPGAILIILSATLALLRSLAFRRIAAIRGSSDPRVARSAENWRCGTAVGLLDSAPSLLGQSKLQRPDFPTVSRRLWLRILETYYFDMCSICGAAVAIRISNRHPAIAVGLVVFFGTYQLASWAVATRLAAR